MALDVPATFGRQLEPLPRETEQITDLPFGLKHRQIEMPSDLGRPLSAAGRVGYHWGGLITSWRI